MKKFGAKAMAVMLGAAIAAGMVSGAESISASAAQTREYQEKYDKVFENFEREDISDTVTLDGDVEDSGKAYLEVTYGEQTMTPDDAIYKQAVPGDSGRGNLVLIMRSPDGSASLDDLVLATRYNDSFPVYGKTMSELNDANLDALPALTGEYQKYVINFANSYEDSEVYEGSNIQVNSGIMVGFHIYSKEGTTGTLEIANIYFTTDDSDRTEASRTMLNHFMGGDRVDITANASTSTWWCGSATGIIRSRSLTVKKGASVEIVNAANPAGVYGYAVIEAEGAGNLSVAVHENGSFGEAKAYDGLIPVSAASDGFRLTAAEGDVVLHRVFFTNCEEDVVATAMPKLNAESVGLLDNFNVAQNGINGDYTEMSTRPEVTASNLYYRLSYNNEDKVSVQNGALVFDATALAENDYINFKTETVTPNVGYSYVVLKAKAEDGASLSGFRFGMQDGPIVWGNGGLVSGTGLPIASLDDTGYVYRTADGWSYIIVDIAESGLANPEGGISVMDMYYSGTGKLFIDEIFFANAVKAELETVNVCQSEAVTFAPDAEGYQWLGYVSAMNDAAAPYLVLRMSGSEGASLESVRLEIKNKADETVGVFWFAENAEGTLLGTDGNVLPALSTTAQDYVIDLAKSGIGTDIGAFHVHSGGTAVGGQITLEQVSYAKTQSSLETVNVCQSEAVTFAPDAEGYQWLGYVSAMNDAAAPYLVLRMSGSEGASLESVRLEMKNKADETIGVFWFAENAEGTLLGTDGNVLPALSTTAQDYVIDLSKSGIGTDIGAFHVHSGGTAVGGEITLEQVSYMAESGAGYADIMAAFPVYEAPDLTAPVITLHVPETAFTGDKVKITASAADDSGNAELTITVVKDGEEIALDANGEFVAQAGVYTVTVTAKDTAENEAEEVRQITVSEKAAEPTKAEETAPTKAASADTATETEESSSHTVVIVIVIIAVVAVAAVVTAVVLKKKKEK